MLLKTTLLSALRLASIATSPGTGAALRVGSSAPTEGDPLQALDGRLRGLLRGSPGSEERLADALRQKLTERILNQVDRPDLPFVDCTTVEWGQTFDVLNSTQLIDLVDAAVSPLFGIAASPSCGCCGFLCLGGCSDAVDCCNGLINFGTQACGGDSLLEGGCCPAYVASGIYGAYIG